MDGARFAHNGGKVWLRSRLFYFFARGRGGNCSPMAVGIGANLCVFGERRGRGKGQEAPRRFSVPIGTRLPDGKMPFEILERPKKQKVASEGFI